MVTDRQHLTLNFGYTTKDDGPWCFRFEVRLFKRPTTFVVDFHRLCAIYVHSQPGGIAKLELTYKGGFAVAYHHPDPRDPEECMRYAAVCDEIVEAWRWLRRNPQGALAS